MSPGRLCCSQSLSLRFSVWSFGERNDIWLRRLVMHTPSTADACDAGCEPLAKAGLKRGRSPDNSGRPNPYMNVSAKATNIRDIVLWRDMYRLEMGCQIIHDSIHERPGWTDEYMLFAAGTAVGYGS